jgi:CDP-diacylglycerol--serine O-phosphatidyltransferase
VPSRYKIIIPNAITLSALFVSFIALVHTLSGNYLSAAWFVWYSSLLDILDGGAARLLKAYSPFGKQLDSLTDIVCAGLTPAILVYQVFFKNWGIAGLLLSFCLLATVAMRLAGFNLKTGQDGEYFRGVPSPVAANVLCSFIVFSKETWGEYRYPGFVAVLLIAVCFLMLTNTRYANTSFMMPSRILRSWQGWLVIGAFCLGLLFPGVALFGFFFMYIIFYTFRGYVWRLLRPLPSSQLLDRA